jgi:nucleoside-diphosphate-sugar epimerase
VRAGIRYSETQLDVEETLLAAINARGLDATIILPTIVYGPNSKAWTLAPATQLQTGTVLLPEKGQGLCNAVYVDDVCQAMIRSAVTPASRGRRYLISGGDACHLVRVLQRFAEALGAPGPQALSEAEMRQKTAGPLGTIRMILGVELPRFRRRLTAWAVSPAERGV